jgi:hypothetical protein
MMRTRLVLCGLLAGSVAMAYGAEAPQAAAGRDNEGIAIWGHSFPADITPERLAAGLRTVGAKRPDRPIVNQSKGGAGLGLSIMQQGGYEWNAEVAGGIIPARGRVELINWRSQTMVDQFNAGLGPIVSKYLPPKGSKADVRVQFNPDHQSPVFSLAPNQGELFTTMILKSISWRSSI